MSTTAHSVDPVDPTAPTDARERIWTRAGVLELLANVALIIVVPLVSRLLHPVVNAPLRGFGFGELVDALSGKGGFTDIGWEVAASKGLVDSSYSAYDTITRLGPLIGMDSYGEAGITHPPPALMFGIPLTVVDYDWWLSFWVVTAFCALALSMRLMRVPAWVAYPLALGICLTPPGMFATMSSYPIAALLISVAWVYRTHSVIAGLAYGVLAATRGVGVILLLYPVAKRRWRTVLVAVALVGVLSLAALAIEPQLVGDFLTQGRASIQMALDYPAQYTFDALLARQGLPQWIAWLAAAAVVLAGVGLKRDFFWLTVWFMFAVTPIAWTHTPVQALPLLVVMWQSGQLGRLLTLLVGVVFVSATPVGWNVAWPFLIVLSAVAVLACPLGRPAQDPQADGPAARKESADRASAV